ATHFTNVFYESFITGSILIAPKSTCPSDPEYRPNTIRLAIAEPPIIMNALCHSV
ncbi:35632_t:CDS:1, partial [Racocetra persica]